MRLRITSEPIRTDVDLLASAAQSRAEVPGRDDSQHKHEWHEIPRLPKPAEEQAGNPQDWKQIKHHTFERSRRFFPPKKKEGEIYPHSHQKRHRPIGLPIRYYVIKIDSAGLLICHRAVQYQARTAKNVAKLAAHKTTALML